MAPAQDGEQKLNWGSHGAAQDGEQNIASNACLALFSLQPQAQRKKLGKKEMPFFEGLLALRATSGAF